MRGGLATNRSNSCCRTKANVVNKSVTLKCIDSLLQRHILIRVSPATQTHSSHAHNSYWLYSSRQQSDLSVLVVAGLNNGTYSLQCLKRVQTMKEYTNVSLFKLGLNMDHIFSLPFTYGTLATVMDYRGFYKGANKPFTTNGTF